MIVNLKKFLKNSSKEKKKIGNILDLKEKTNENKFSNIAESRKNNLQKRTSFSLGLHRGNTIEDIKEKLEKIEPIVVTLHHENSLVNGMLQKFFEEEINNAKHNDIFCEILKKVNFINEKGKNKLNSLFESVKNNNFK